MKKHYLTIAIMALALGITARSLKTNEATAPATTQVQTTEAVTTFAEAEDSLEEDYLYGFIDEVNNKIITVAEGEDKAVKSDITSAKIIGTDAIGMDDEVRVTFNGEMSRDVTEAESAEIITLAAEEAEAEAAAENDEIISRTIEKANDRAVALKTENGTYTFNTLIARKMTREDIRASVNADVTLYGDLEDKEDKPVIAKIVTGGAEDTSGAEMNALTGKVAEVKSDYVVLDTVDPENTLFTFLGARRMFNGVKVGDAATMTYEDTLTDKAIRITGIK